MKVMDTRRFIQNVKDDNEAIQSELANIKTQVTDMASKFEEEIKSKPSHQEVNAMIEDRLSTLETHDNSMVDNVLAEIVQRSKRVNNIVIHGVAESTSEIREERISHDTQLGDKGHIQNM